MCIRDSFYAGFSGIGRCGTHIHHVLHTVDLLFQRSDNTVQNSLCIGPGIEMCIRDRDKTVKEKYADLEYSADKLEEYLEQVLQIEAVASKDWLTNKVDRSVSVSYTHLVSLV